MEKIEGDHIAPLELADGSVYQPQFEVLGYVGGVTNKGQILPPQVLTFSVMDNLPSRIILGREAFAAWEVDPQLDFPKQAAITEANDASKELFAALRHARLQDDSQYQSYFG